MTTTTSADLDLLARAIDRSPFHAARLSGIDRARFELADLARLPVMLAPPGNAKTGAGWLRM